MLIAEIFAGILAYFLNSYYSGKFIGYSSWMQIKDFAPSYVIAILVALSVYFLKYLPLSCWIILPLQFLIGTMMFFLICSYKKVEEYDEMRSIVVSYFLKRH